ncbi:hypothetical protein [Sphingomonas parva]|nr:hypothetical protein [Sphingomonas parva]
MAADYEHRADRMEDSERRLRAVDRQACQGTAPDASKASKDPA